MGYLDEISKIDPTKVAEDLASVKSLKDSTLLKESKDMSSNAAKKLAEEIDVRKNEGAAWTEKELNSTSNPNSNTDAGNNPNSTNSDSLNTSNTGNINIGNVYNPLIPDDGPRRTQSMFNYDEDTFKYGLSDFSKNFDFLKYEDPTFLGFDLFISQKSSLLDAKSLKSFITQYSEIPDVKVREILYNKFIATLGQLFNLEGDVFLNKKRDRNRPYYIKNINGLDKLNAKIVKYKEDKITFDLNEDVTMIALYLAELYNNLNYDYRLQKYMFPENLLRFDMVIRITDLRSFKKWNDSTGSYEINPEVSSQYYILRDCNFDFEKSQIHGSDLSMAGFDSTLNTTSANLKFDIYYKSVERLFNPLMITQDILYSKRIRSGDRIRNMTDSSMASTDFEFSRYKKSVEQIRKEAVERKVNKSFSTKDRTESWIINAAPTEWEDVVNNQPTFLETLSNTLNENVQDFKGDVMNKLRGFRGDLLREVVYQVRDVTGIPEIYPNNVYAEDYYDLTLQNVIGDLIGDLSGDIEDEFLDVVPTVGETIDLLGLSGIL